MKRLTWFRLYSEAVDDEKLRLLAFEDRWHFVALLCCKAQGILEEEGELRNRKIAVKLGLSIRELDEVARRLADVGLIDRETFNPLAWDHRQFVSDQDLTAAERQKKWREKQADKKRNEEVTRYVTDESRTQETETETETEQKKTKRPRAFTPPSVEEIKTYCTQRSNGIDPEYFHSYYQGVNWMRGKTKIKDWQGVIRTWEQRNKSEAPQQQPVKVKEFPRAR